jgi:magnesium transporter
MAEALTITLSYLRAHPETAASELSNLEPAAAAAFLAEVPDEIGAPVLARVSPWFGARIVGELEPRLAASIVRDMAISDATPILRHIPEAEREVVLAELPKRLAASFRNSLSYPMWSVGAWMDRDALSLEEQDSVETAIATLRRQDRDVGSHCHVVDDERRFVGIVEIAEILRADDATTIGVLADRRVPTFYGRTRLTTAASHEGWSRYDALPILGRKNNPIGRLRRIALREGLNADVEISTPVEEPVLLATAQAFVQTLPALVNALMAAPLDPTKSSERGNP